jgi:hypothetical protein
VRGQQLTLLSWAVSHSAPGKCCNTLCSMILHPCMLLTSAAYDLCTLRQLLIPVWLFVCPVSSVAAFTARDPPPSQACLVSAFCIDPSSAETLVSCLVCQVVPPVQLSDTLLACGMQ